MKIESKARRSAPQTLKKARSSYAKRLKTVEKARARLEKARRKLRDLEVELAELARSDHAERTRPSGKDARKTPKLRQACLIFNPQSKGAVAGTYHAGQIVDCLRSYGIAADLRLKMSGKVARRLAKEAVDQGAELVIVAAGDGTIEDVVAELVGSKTSLGIIPIGTMNNVARSLGVPLELEDACALLGMGATRHVDVGRVMTGDKPHGAYFLETAGVGLSALAAPLGQDAEKGRWAMFVEMLGKFFTSRAASMRVSCDDDEDLQAHTHLVTVSNAPLFGDNMLIAPDAKMDDGYLDVALYDGMNKIELERYFLSIANGKCVDDPQVTFRRARRVRISAAEPLEANADMDVLAGQPTWEIDVVPGALSAIVGKGIALTLPVDAVPAVPPLSGPQPPRVEPSAAGQTDSGPAERPDEHLGDDRLSEQAIP